MTFFLTLLIRLRGYRFSGLTETRAAYAEVLRTGPVLICAPHVSLWDGLLLWWVFARPRRVAIIVDPGSFSSPLVAWCLRSWWGAVVVRQGAGLAGAAIARRECALRFGRGEALLLFPSGTVGGSASYLAGALATDFPNVPIVMLGLAYGPVPVAWGLPRRGARIGLNWKPHRPETAAVGLRGLWDRAGSINQSMAESRC